MSSYACAPDSSCSPRQLIEEAIAHLDHVLPGQAPIHDFVHHNTLHGFQHLPFEQALAQFTALTGIDCYLPVAQFRAFYQQGRITDDDLDAVLRQQFGESLDEVPGAEQLPQVTKQALYRIALLQDLTPTTPGQLHWYWSEHDGQGQALWLEVLAALGLQEPGLHPEDLLDLSAEQAEDWLSAGAGDSDHLQVMRAQSSDGVNTAFAMIGERQSLRGWFLSMTGKDILETVRPQLIRLCASWLDEGMAAWRLPGSGLYQTWREGLRYDPQRFFHESGDWQAVTAGLPEQPVDAIQQQLEALAIPVAHWAGYLQRLALELPGWSGLINWRQTHPSYRNDDAARPQLADYLALRLILDRLQLLPLCRALWHCDVRVDKLQHYFVKHPDEFFVRQQLFQGALPEYLTQAGQALLADPSRAPADWRTLAERIWTWQQSPLGSSLALSVHDHGWRLWRVCQALSYDPADVAKLNRSCLLSWLAVIDAFTETQRNYVWLCAYERHYREDLLRALQGNRGRGRWASRDTRPQAQVFFCMDEREESLRRHLEELNPAIETLGAAGFFGVAMNYKALDAHGAVPLCPVVVTPAHEVDEVTVPGHESELADHRRGLHLAESLGYAIYQSTRRHPGLAYPVSLLYAPLKLWRLLMKMLAPTWQRLLEHRWQSALVSAVTTQVTINAADPTVAATPSAPRIGFSDQEQAERVANFLKTTGLTYGFAPIVVIIGHGSTSQNNPHEAAHDCGACGGRQGGPNARVFAAMANRPEVRALLSARGIRIPADTWFVGAQHDTCSDVITWFDLLQLPADRRAEFEHCQHTLLQADALAARERCRRFHSSGYPSLSSAAIRHVENRATDLSQVRPEYGHATNAAAFIGRRSATQGVFFDRRLFLISYDPTQDADGTIVENILLTAGPVGAGINLEYYFSTVNNDRLGCGTKIPHNVTGLFGVMEGAGSDLRTGLPLQMVEIHEAMRLQIVVEASPSVLESIYGRQPALQELVGGGWVHLSCLHPDTGEIFVFERGRGFQRWTAAAHELPLRESSADCYRDSWQAVSPMLVKQPDESPAHGADNSPKRPPQSAITPQTNLPTPRENHC